MDENPQIEELSIDPDKTVGLQRRLHRGAILGILLTSILVGCVSAVLLYRAHAQTLAQELLFNLELVSTALESEVARLKNSVVQITSRTRIRQELARYNRGEINLDSLTAFTEPKLQDVLRLSPDIRGIARLDLQGRVLARVGVDIPRKHWPGDYIADVPALGSIQVSGSGAYVVVSAPIHNRLNEKVGIDLALFDASRLNEIVKGFFDRQPGSGRVQISGLVESGARAFLVHGNRSIALSPEKLLEETWEAIGQGPEEGLHTDSDAGPLVAHRHIRGSAWALLFMSPAEEFFAPAQRLAGYVMLTFIGLSLVGSFLTHRVMHPVSGKILIGTQGLYELLGRNRELLSRARESESQLQAIIDKAPAVIYTKDLNGAYRLVNSAYEEFTGLSRDQVIGRSDHELFPTAAADGFRANDREVFASGRAVELDEQAPNRHGMHEFLSIRFPLHNEQQQVYGLCGISTDITERKQHERKLRQLAAVFASTEEAILLTDANGDIVDINPAFSRIMGYTRQQVLGRNPRMFRSDRQDRHFYELMWDAIVNTGSWRGEIWNTRSDGSLIPALVSITGITDEHGDIGNYVAVYSDISAIKQSEERLGHLAHHDPLTDLPNRVLLDIRMDHAIRRAKRSGRQLGVIFLDLDHFKNVNDSLGHKAGDELLVEVAQLLRNCLRNDDTVARIGGDEFVLLLEEVDTPMAIIQVVEKILQALDRPFVVSGQSIRVTASLGASLYPDDGNDGSLLMRNADAAMYQAKAEGRNTYNFYTQDLTRQAFERMQLESWLRDALGRDEFSLHYQPQIDLRSGRLAGLEALLRWTRPDGTSIPPGQFIPVAENSDLIHALGRWILLSACHQARQWLDQGIDFGRMAINISGKQISAGNLVEHLDETLRETGLPPQYLELELTESFVMGEPRGAIDTLRQLRERGVTLTVDDFGTGYSSLAYLKSLPIQRLKIDRSFIRDINEDSNDAAITRAVIALGGSLQLEVVGEGVETQEQLTFLRDQGCDLGQGYLFARPQPPQELVQLIERGNWLGEP